MDEILPERLLCRLSAPACLAVAVLASASRGAVGSDVGAELV